ncbi:MAG: PEGA domain-containing protein [Patescibacteria group bacterium]
MKRKFGFLVIFVVVTLIIFGAVRLLGSRAPKEGELRVDAAPTVSVFLDNKHIGRTPLREKVTAGEYTIRLVAETTTGEIAPWQAKISVGANLLTYVNAVLSESELSSAVDVLWLEKSVVGKPELSVITNPDGASVVLDDVTKGITPLTISDMTAGDHMLTVTSPGFLTRTMKVKLTAGYKLIASMKLALSAGGVPQPEATPAATTLTTPTLKSGAAATSSATPQKPYVLIKDTPTGFLRVRMEPSTAATEAGRVNPGEKYHLFNQQTGWYQISHDGTNKGWISAQYADKVE